MGNCASCLGLDRRQHDSQDGDLDRILDSRQPSYGAIDIENGSAAHTEPDEDEMRREREALDHITAAAANSMIDVMHPSRSDLDHTLALANSHHTIAVEARERAPGVVAELSDADADAEEAAWLESIQSSSIDAVRLPKAGDLTMDMSLLRAG